MIASVFQSLSVQFCSEKKKIGIDIEKIRSLGTEWKMVWILSQNFNPNILKSYRSPVIQCVITDRFNNPFLFRMPSISYFSASESLFFSYTLSLQPWEPLTDFQVDKNVFFCTFRSSDSLNILQTFSSIHIFIPFVGWFTNKRARTFPHTYISPTNNQPNRMDVTVNARLFNIA